MPSASDLVTLRGGLAVPLAALELLWSLEARRCSVTLEPGDVLRVGPRDQLTDADRLAIRRWKLDLVALTKYCEADAMEQTA